MNLRLLVVAAAGLFMAGCYSSHLGGSCDADPCGEGLTCCPGCDGRPVCVAVGVSCESVTTDCGDCRTNYDCPGGTVCRFESCGAGGRCVPGTPFCPGGSCPGVCGCDGTDWCNECEATTFGVSVAHTGSCCGAGSPCESGQSCCMTCDGTRFCTAGDCPAVVCDCRSNADCADGQYCKFEVRTCGAIGGGVCDDIPTSCSGMCPGVCGCDGNDYCSFCTAAMAGVNVALTSPCETGCGPPGGRCSSGDYCETGPSCDSGSPLASCASRPLDCSDPVDPVCGCNGLLYESACAANRSGVSVGPPSICECLGAACPRQSCRAHQLADPDAPSGAYPILDPASGEVNTLYCDMDGDGGGWTLVASSRLVPLRDERGGYHAGLAEARPSDATLRGVFDGLLGAIPPVTDVRFVCGAVDVDAPRVDLSFYDVDWYGRWTRGTDEQSCFAAEFFSDPTPPERRNNLTGARRMRGRDWQNGPFQGEDDCGSSDDFTIDFDDRGMDSDEGDGTDWGADDGSPKCGDGPLTDGYWMIFVRE